MHPNLRIEPLPPVTLKDFVVRESLTVAVVEIPTWDRRRATSAWKATIEFAGSAVGLADGSFVCDLRGWGSSASLALTDLVAAASGRAVSAYPHQTLIAVPRLSAHGFAPADLDGRP